MKLLDLTLPDPAENLALDEALLEAAEEGALEDEVLRLWEPKTPLVVVGRSSRVRDEVDLAACEAARMPVLRRASGGAAIVTGPGCLMYALVLRYQAGLRLLDEIHRHVLGTIANAMRPLAAPVECAGTSDLAINGRKFSGNSVRCKRSHFLYHGTLLYAFDLPSISRFLTLPARQPQYRQRREHQDFVTNLNVQAADLKAALAEEFNAFVSLTDWPAARTRELAATRYSQEAWNFER